MTPNAVRRELAAYEATSEELVPSWERQAREEAEAAAAAEYRAESEAYYREKLAERYGW